MKTNWIKIFRVILFIICPLTILFGANNEYNSIEIELEEYLNSLNKIK